MMRLATGWRMRRALLVIATAGVVALLVSCYTSTAIQPVGDPRPRLSQDQQVSTFSCIGRSDEQCAAVVKRPFQVVANIQRVDDTRNFFTELFFPESCRINGESYRGPGIRFPEAALRSALRELTKTARSLGANGVVVYSIVCSQDKVDVRARAIYFDEQPPPRAPSHDE
jgi:hypothetical protein